MRALVTLAPEGVEPYASGVRGLAKVAALAGWEFLALGDADLHGDRPWQAKRFAIRRGFELGADRVVWCDADVEVADPFRLAALLNSPGPEGVWCYQVMDASLYFVDQGRRNRADAFAWLPRNLWVQMAAATGADVFRRVWMFEDWLQLWNVSAADGLRMCDEWDRIAALLLAEGLTWSDGVSVGLAAAACGVPVVQAIDAAEVHGSIRHLLNSFRKGLYSKTGKVLP